MSYIPSWKPLNAVPVAATMHDIAPRPRLNLHASLPPSIDTSGGSGLAKLFGGARDALAGFFRPMMQLQPAYAESMPGRRMPGGVRRPSVMFMESEGFARGRKAAHAARVRYERLPLSELERLVAEHRRDIQTSLKLWAHEIIRYLGDDLWGDQEELPSLTRSHDVDFWEDVSNRVKRVFQMTARHTDEQSQIAGTVVHEETVGAIGVSSEAFEKVVAERLPDGDEFIALIRTYEDVSDLYHSTLQPEIERREALVLEPDSLLPASDEIDDDGPPPGYLP